MTEAVETQTEAPKKAKGPKGTPKPNYSRRTLRTLGRKKRAERLQKEPEFAKAWFERKSKNSNARKLAFRKRHSKTGASA